MWLLDTSELTLHEFYGEIPPYAILSHRWEEEEISFQSILGEHPADLKGYKKVKQFCEIAKQRGYKYGWVDTCCIDKKSSAELSEAINSMFRWYADAQVCYAYLCDVRKGDRNSFAQSQWFTRGWTLQELLAPRRLCFYDMDWNVFGSRDDLQWEIEQVTGIPKEAMRLGNLNKFSVAAKMCWASKRQTTRQEDIAYCLLGIFDINMPLLYGEGDRAFQRLQEEIMRVNTDMTLFAWQGTPCKRFGMLASSPSCFESSPLRNDGKRKLEGHSRGLSLNNAGISLTAVAFPCFKIRKSLSPTAPLATDREICAMLLSPAGMQTMRSAECIYIEKRRDGEDEYFERVSVNGRQFASFDCHLQPCLDRPALESLQHGQIFINRAVASAFTTDLLTDGFIELDIRSNHAWTVRQNKTMSRLELRHWDVIADQSLAPVDGYHCVDFSYSKARSMVGFVGCFTVTILDCVELLVAFGLDDHWNVICVGLLPCEKGRQNRLNSAALMEAYVRLIGSHDPEQAFSSLDAQIMVFAARGRCDTEDGPGYMFDTLGIRITPSIRCLSGRADREGRVFSCSIIVDEGELVRQSLEFAKMSRFETSAGDPNDVPYQLLKFAIRLHKAREKVFLVR